MLPQGKLLKVGRLSPKVRAFVESKGLTPSTDEIVLPDKRLLRMRRDVKRGAGIALPESVIRRLPALLRKPKAVLWEKDRNDLLYVFDVPGDARKGKVILKVSYEFGKGASKKERPAIISGGLVRLDKLQDVKTYSLVDGALD